MNMTHKQSDFDTAARKPALQWYACRIKRKQLGGIATTTIGGEFETYRDRQGRLRKRRVAGTGERVFVPQRILTRAGFEVFLPVRKVRQRKNRYSPDQVYVTQPLLADWLFVGWAADAHRWHRLMELDVVTGVMGTGGRPVRIPQDRLARLMRQWGGKMLTPECLRIAKGKTVYTEGDVIKVPDGPFEGFDFTVVDVAERSVRGLVDIFGRETPLELSLNKVPDRVVPSGPKEIVPGDLDACAAHDPALRPCSCGQSMALVLQEKNGFCVCCGHCGGRAAVGSRTRSEAVARWNAWSLSVAPYLVLGG